MKKLILVTSLAVAASWLLSEAGQPGDEKTAAQHAWNRVVLETHLPPPPVLAPLPPVEPLPPLAPLPPVPPVPPEAPRPRRASRVKPESQPRPQPQPRTQPSPTVGAREMPSWFPKSEAEEESREKADAFGSRVLLGRLSASEDRARLDLRKTVEREVADWLAADVPPSWKVPARLIDSMAQGSYTQEITKSLIPATPEAEVDGSSKTEDAAGVDGLYTLYRAGQKLDFSSRRRAEIVGIYRRDLATQRMHRMGGGLVLALVGLAVLSGYIRADEATKGYYTNRLRLVAAAGLGAAGVAAYRFLA